MVPHTRSDSEREIVRQELHVTLTKRTWLFALVYSPARAEMRLR